MTEESSAVELFARWREAALAALGAAREECDALNVFPVPDGDTGTNVYLTVEAAQQAAGQAEERHAAVEAVARAYVDGALRGARGSSGVIVSQLLRAAVPMLVPVGPDADPTPTGGLVAAVLRAASDAAWAAVARPVEGTILSVARAAADGAAAVGGEASLQVVLRAATRAAHEALDRTPEQLEVLRSAGVVDAGGRALVVLLDTTERVLTGRVDPHARAPRTPDGGRPRLPVPQDRPDDVSSAAGPAYEVLYLLDADAAAVPGLRAALDPLGDSLVVVGGDGLWRVHVHVDDPGAAIEAGIAAGRPHQVVVTPFSRHHGGGQPVRPAGRGQLGATRAGDRGRVVVMTAAGPGLAALFTSAGAVVVDGAGGHRPRAQELVDAALACGVAQVVVLPNDGAVVAGAEAAAHELRDRGVRVGLIPTRAQLQGLAALAVHDPARGFDDDVVHMSAAAGQTRHGAVTVASRAAMTMAGPCEPGDVLGVVDGDFALVGTDLGEVAARVADRLLGGSGELVTVVSGAAAPDDLAAGLEAHVRSTRPEVDVSVHDGGQPRYPLLLAVE